VEQSDHSLKRKQGDTGVLHSLGCGIGSPVEASTIAPAAVRLNGRMGCGPSADPHQSSSIVSDDI
jgi:hypothetical protein